MGELGHDRWARCESVASVMFEWRPDRESGVADGGGETRTAGKQLQEVGPRLPESARMRTALVSVWKHREDTLAVKGPPGHDDRVVCEP